MTEDKEYAEKLPTCVLVNELTKREGVKEIIAETPDSVYIVTVWDEQKIPAEVDTGPARILIVID